MPTSTLAINGPRLWDTIMASARIGPGRIETGLRRLALTDADREMRDLFVRWCRDAGCIVTVDRMGSIFARREGTDPALAPVLIGSHLDTQIAGGRFDGILGVLSGLEVIRTLNDAGVRTRRAVELVSWTNEEGARFAPPMLASAVFGGVRSLEWALGRTEETDAPWARSSRASATRVLPLWAAVPSTRTSSFTSSRGRSSTRRASRSAW